mmetsp:Transcript_44174/g.122840  ORF Transcript_44174/g.122840 Transcript_44174/m.122840 type:complete len:264 (-) Transcript_44174:64-855(-)
MARHSQQRVKAVGFTFSGACLVRPSPRGGVVAVDPGALVLEGVIGRPAVGARVVPQAHPVAHHGEVRDARDAELRQAVPHPAVLTPVVVAVAGVPAGEVRVQCLLGDGLEGAEHHGPRRHWLVAVNDVGLLARVGLQVAAEPVSNHDRVRVHLDCPIRELVGADPLHGRPDIHKKLHVARGTVHTLDDHGLLEVVRPHLAVRPVAQPGLAVLREDVVHLALEDADAPVGPECLPHEAGLVGAEHEHGKAVERRPTPLARRADA